MAAEGTHLIRLLQGKNAGRIRTSFELRRDLGRTGSFNHEVRPGAGTPAGRVAPSGPQPIGRPGRERSHAGNEVVALDVRIEHLSGADSHRDVTARANGIDRDDGGSAGDPSALHGAEAQRTAADYSNSRGPLAC